MTPWFCFLFQASEPTINGLRGIDYWNITEEIFCKPSFPGRNSWLRPGLINELILILNEFPDICTEISPGTNLKQKSTERLKIWDLRFRLVFISLDASYLKSVEG